MSESHRPEDPSNGPPKRRPPGSYYTDEMRQRALDRIRKRREKDPPDVLRDRYIHLLFRTELRRLAGLRPELAPTLDSVLTGEA